MKICFKLCLALIPSVCFAQNDTIRGENSVIISASKWEQNLGEVPNKIFRISENDIAIKSPQTSADMLAQTGVIYVQKSQQAGGSPMIRGFATNRILLVVDGVRMNNAIYRSGNIQNVISIDPLSLQSAEIIFGPGSTLYGSDAIGGVMDFHIKNPEFKNTDSSSKKGIIKGMAFGRYSTANRENTFHTELHVQGKKLASFSSISFSKFGDVKMGKYGGYAGYTRPEYVQRINGRDSIVKNPDPRKQIFTGFDQLNLVQKLGWKISPNASLQYNFYYSETGKAPRYDRLIEYRNNLLRFAEWNYGPMTWAMHSLQGQFNKKTQLYDALKISIAQQYYTESRIDRQRNNPNRRTQKEKVGAISGNFDANLSLKKGELFYGGEWVNNLVHSDAWSSNINTETRTSVATRYPDGSTWKSLGIYGLYKINLNALWTINAGIRYNYAVSKSTFVKDFVDFPFDKAEVRNGGFTPGFGVVYRPRYDWEIKVNISTGFRVPNIDDIGKLFESNPGNVVFPNPELSSEKALNAEIGIRKGKSKKYLIELVGFHTRLNNAILRRPSTINGQDSIMFDGILSQVETLQNVGLATVWGVQAEGNFFISTALKVYTYANYIYGRETDDNQNTQVALRHAPPFYGMSGLNYKYKKWEADIFCHYNSKISAENMAPSEAAKTTIYAKDASGKPFSPSWYTLNIRWGIQFNKVRFFVNWENITNQQYRTYSSGMVAPGTNLMLAIQFQF